MSREVPGCTFDVLIGSLRGMRVLAAAELPAKLSYKVLKLSEEIEAELKRYEKLRVEIQDSDIPNEEKGVKMAELADVGVDSEFSTIPLEELLESGVDIPANDLRGLLPFLDE